MRSTFSTLPDVEVFRIGAFHNRHWVREDINSLAARFNELSAGSTPSVPVGAELSHGGNVLRFGEVATKAGRAATFRA
jgi:hypothetical protein